MKIIDVIDRVAVFADHAVLFLPNGFEINLDLALAHGFASGMSLEAEFCQTLLLKLTINDKVIFAKKKEELLPEMENLRKALTIEAEDEKRTEINLESSRRVKKLLPLFKTRINVLMANSKSFMQPKDWIKELKAAETLQNIYLLFKEQGVFKKYASLGAGTLPQLYPDYTKLDNVTRQSVFMLVNALLEDVNAGLNPENEASVKQQMLTSRVLKVPNIIGEEVRVADLVTVAGI